VKTLQYPENSFSAGVNYMIEGMKLIWHPQLRVYILVPLIVNVLLFIGLTSVLMGYFWSMVDGSSTLIPEWLAPYVAPFKWFVWTIVGALLLIIYGYAFNVITNIIAAPFYGLLAESAEKLLTGNDLPPESLWSLVPRVLMREMNKLTYFILRGLLVILLMILVGFIPVIQTLAPFIGLAWGAWSMSIQYADYPADNHHVEFYDMRICLWNRIRSSIGFGGTVMGCSIIPFINIIAMPAAVAGGTIFWLNELKQHADPSITNG